MPGTARSVNPEILSQYPAFIQALIPLIITRKSAVERDVYEVMSRSIPNTGNFMSVSLVIKLQQRLGLMSITTCALCMYTHLSSYKQQLNELIAGNLNLPARASTYQHILQSTTSYPGAPSTQHQPCHTAPPNSTVGAHAPLPPYHINQQGRHAGNLHAPCRRTSQARKYSVARLSDLYHPVRTQAERELFADLMRHVSTFTHNGNIDFHEMSRMWNCIAVDSNMACVSPDPAQHLHLKSPMHLQQYYDSILRLQQGLELLRVAQPAQAHQTQAPTLPCTGISTRPAGHGNMYASQLGLGRGSSTKSKQCSACHWPKMETHAVGAKHASAQKFSSERCNTSCATCGLDMSDHTTCAKTDKFNRLGWTLEGLRVNRQLPQLPMSG